MKMKAAAALLATLALLFVVPSGAGARGPHGVPEASAPVQSDQVDKRELLAEDGRRIVITTLGNLVAFESPRGFEHYGGGLEAPIDGYVLAYRDPATNTVRVLHNVYRSQSSTIEPGLGDFVPLSFDGPDPGNVFERGELAQASVVVGTRDGLVQIRTTYSWIRGMVRVESLVTAVKRRIQILSFKRQTRAVMDGAGAYAVKEAKFDVLPVGAPPPVAGIFLGPSIVFSTALCCRRFCDPDGGPCPPMLPDFSEEAVNTHSILLEVGRDAAAPKALLPTYLDVADAQDDCERVTAGRCQGSELPRFAQDSQATAGWLLNRGLGVNRSLLFVMRTSVY
jgi:hypothetical protein